MNKGHLLALDEEQPPTAEYIMGDFYRSLIESRLDAGMSQTRLAEITGIPQSAIAKIETGKGNPTLNTIVKMAEALGVWIELTPTAPKRRHLL